jgi:N-methylhydantoinase A
MKGPQIKHAAGGATTQACSARQAYFGVDHGFVETSVIGRNALRDEWSAGPLIVEEYESTTIVPPYARARIDDGANVLIELNS